MALPTNPPWLEQFKKDGVAPVGRLLTDSERKEASDHVDGLIEKNLHSDMLDGVEGQGKFFRLVNLHTHDDWFWNLIRHEAILDVAEAALGPNIQYYQDQLFYKPAKIGGPAFWHSDNLWWKADPPEMVVVWLALDDATEENGVIRYLPGSHLMKDYSPDQLNHDYDDVIEKHADTDRNALLDTQQLDLSKETFWPVPAGHALIHHCQMVHSSPPNKSDKPRRAYTVILYRAGLFGHTLEEAPLLRGKMPD